MLLALLGRGRFPFVDVVEHADQLGSHVDSLVAEDLFLPLTEVRRSDPDRVVDAGIDETLRALVQERVLARPRAEALAEQHDLGPGSTGIRRSRSEIASIRSRACRVTFADPVERQRRRSRCVLHRDRRAVPARQHFEHADGGVVHVAGTGRQVDEQPLTFEGVGAFELAHRERDPLHFALGALEADVDADHVHRVLAHDLRDHLGSLRVPYEAPALLRHRVVRNFAVEAAAQVRKTGAAGRTTARPIPRAPRSSRSRVASRSACPQ